MTGRAALPVLLLALGTQLAFAGLRPAAPHRSAAAIGQPPPPYAVRLAALGDEVALSRLLMLSVLAADSGPDGGTPLRELDYGALRAWLERASELDPRSPQPLLAASQVYAAVSDPARARLMLDFVHARFLRDPDRHWPWLAHAAVAARHQLQEPALAASYARELRNRTSPGVLPLWAQELEAWFAEDMNELDTARALIGGLIESGHVTDPRELRLLERRLEELENAQR